MLAAGQPVTQRSITQSRRGNSPLAPSRAAAEHGRMDANQAPPVTARIAATVPLLRAGLERAAGESGLVVVPAGEHARVTLRSVDQPPSGTGVDVASADRSVVVTFRAVPDAHTWRALLALLPRLLDQADEDDC